MHHLLWPIVLSKGTEFCCCLLVDDILSSFRNFVYGACYSVVELETSWEKESCIEVELGNFFLFPFWFGIVLYINRLFVINEYRQFFLQSS